MRDGAGGEGLEVDQKLVGIEAHRHVEAEAGGDRRAGGRRLAGPEGDEAARRGDGEVGRHRLDDRTAPGGEVGAVALDELEEATRAVAAAERLIARRWTGRGRAGLGIRAVAPAKAVEPAAPLLEEGDDGGERVEAAHPIAG